MAEYTQANRPIRIDTSLGEDVLLLTGFRGIESMSSPYRFQVELVSLDPSIAADDVLRQPACLTIALADGTERVVHGLINRFVKLGRDGDLVGYRAEVVPWLWFLSLGRDCRIFQSLSVLEIVEQVFRGLGHADFQIQCTQTYPKREYCVQYRETHLDFVSRLLEEEGIYYEFEHSSSKHELLLKDSNVGVKRCAGDGLARLAPRSRANEDVVLTLEDEHTVHTGAVALRDYDYLQPTLSLESSVDGGGPEEVYDYHPGRFNLPEQGARYARLRLEAEETLRQTIRGRSTCRAFEAGCRFDLQEHFRTEANQPYRLLRIEHSALGIDFRSREPATLEYHNDFVAIPLSVPYRPALKTRRPVIRSSQTALVVGPAGEEVYVDPHGRVKVQFYWDRQGRRDENSSCWVRVATPWGGKGYGSVSIPRVGSEVVVVFLEGDPDRPLIVANVYNAEQAPPYGLPAAGITMGMKSRSSPGGGGQNELTMSDTKGKEVVNIRAQYDLTQTVQHDQTVSVNNNLTTTVAVDDTVSIGANQKIDVGGNRDLTVAGNETVTVGGTGTVAVGGDRTTTVGGNDTTSVGSNLALDAGSNLTLNAESNLEAAATANVTVDGKEVSITGATKITLSCAGSSIEIGPSGISITSPAIVQVQGTTIKLN